MGVMFFVAGSTTTINFLSNAIAVLEGRPDLWKLLTSGDDEACECIIEEILRLESPVQYLARTIRTDVEINGTVIPEGARAILLYGAANRDPDRWPDPDILDPNREQKRHLAFGEGIHFCMGAPLARLEAKIFLPVFGKTVADYEIHDRSRVPSHHELGWQNLRANVELATKGR
jgi:cytochrome P450